MIRGGSALKWYWSLDTRVLLAAIFGIAIATVLLLRIPILVIVEGVLLTITADKARRYRERICEETGSDVRPPRWFVLFWWVIIALELMWFTVRFVQGATG
jgi:hypothetical protein